MRLACLHTTAPAIAVIRRRVAPATGLRIRSQGSTAMIGKRVLLVGDFSRSSFGAYFYNTNFILHAGLIRAGCHVLPFSDRDVAREASVLRRKTLGRAAMSRALVKVAGTYRPDLVLFGHADMCGADTFAAIRMAAPGVRIAQFNVDALFRSRTMARFRDRALHMDVSFITTAAPQRLRSLGAPAGTIAYFPNPVDASLAVSDLSQQSRADISFDGIFLGTGIERRPEQISGLMDHLPESFRFFVGGGIAGTPRLTGASFLEMLSSGAMSPNLPLDDTVTVDFLYSSDRIAHLLGHGIVAFCQSEAGLETLYEDGIVTYTNIADLAAKMAALAQDDTRRRKIAATGRRIASERTGAEQVARYMLDMVLGDGPAIDYGWPSELI